MRRKFRTPDPKSIERFASTVLLSMIAGLALSACVDSHSIPGTREGLLADAGGGDGDGDVDMPDAGPPPPSCDPAQCEGATSMFLGNAPGCCTEDDLCGLDFSAAGLAACLERDAPGREDSSCPSTSILGFINFPGCCAKGGTCGTLVQSVLPLGCVPGDVQIPIPGFPSGTPSRCAFAGPD